jgi:hypothetical protein
MKKVVRFALALPVLAVAFAAPSSKVEAITLSPWLAEGCCTYVTSPGTFERQYVYVNGKLVATDNTRCNPGLCRA